MTGSFLIPMLPCVIGLILIEGTLGILQTRPFHQIVNVLEMIVEGHAVDAAVLCDVANGDLGQRFFQQQIFQRLF